MVAHSSPLLDAALQYAGRGWPVFAVSFSKVPFKGSHGCLDGTADPAALAAMWQRHPRANVALATGNIVVFDCDGDAGLARFLALGKGPRTLVARTPRGGWHFFYTVPDGVRIRSKAEPRLAGSHDGLDVRGEGGFVVLPPSRTRNGDYVWANDVPPAPCPDYLVSFTAQIGAHGQERSSNPIAVPAHVVAGRLPHGDRFMQALTAGMDLELTEHERARVWSALQSIKHSATKPIGYDDFIKIGFSLHSLNWVRSDGTDIGFELWDQWAGSNGYPETSGTASREAKWNSFAAGTDTRLRTVGIGTLFGMARDAGWRGDVVNVPALPPTTVAAPTMAPAGLGGSPSGAQINGTTVALPAAFTAKPIVFPDTDNRGRPKLTCSNAIVAIEGMELSCTYDTMHEKMRIGGAPIAAWSGDLSDHTVAMLRRVIFTKHGFDPGERNTRDAAVACCLAHSFNPVIDYLDGLQWDRRDRIDHWTMRYLGATDTELHRAFGRLMLLAAVRRARRPGTKFDQIVVLEGPQGIGKSTAVKILAGPENYSDQHILGASDREQQEAAAGSWLHEIAELAGMRRTDVERIKLFARRTEDRARPAYGHFRLDKPRQCVFVATTNEQAYLKEWDRAFWPILCGGIDLVGLARDRDQLWAEAAHFEALGGSIELDSKLRGIAAEHIAERQETDSWEDLIQQAIGPSRDTSINDILTGNHFLMRANDISHSNQMRVARILKKFGWERYKARDGENRSWRYRKVGPLGPLGTK